MENRLGARTVVLGVLTFVTAALLLSGIALYLWQPDLVYEWMGQRAPACKNPEGDAAGKEDVGSAWRMTYRWHFSNEDWELSVTVPKEDYYAFQREDRPTRLVRIDGELYQQPAYDEYVTHAGDDRAIRTIADELVRIGQGEGWSEAKILSFTLAFIQCMPYTPDDVTDPINPQDKPRYPLETLVDAGGDCEDTSILYASLILEMGHEAVLLSPPEHMAVGVEFPPGTAGSGYDYGGRWYLYAETTGDGFGIGDIPAEYQGGEVQVFELDGG